MRVRKCGRGTPGARGSVSFPSCPLSSLPLHLLLLLTLVCRLFRPSNSHAEVAQVLLGRLGGDALGCCVERERVEGRRRGWFERGGGCAALRTPPRFSLSASSFHCARALCLQPSAYVHAPGAAWRRSRRRWRPSRSKAGLSWLRVTRPRAARCAPHSQGRPPSSETPVPGAPATRLAAISPPLRPRTWVTHQSLRLLWGVKRE